MGCLERYRFGDGKHRIKRCEREWVFGLVEMMMGKDSDGVVWVGKENIYISAVSFGRIER